MWSYTFWQTVSVRMSLTNPISAARWCTSLVVQVLTLAREPEHLKNHSNASSQPSTAIFCNSPGHAIGGFQFYVFQVWLEVWHIILQRIPLYYKKLCSVLLKTWIEEDPRHLLQEAPPPSLIPPHRALLRRLHQQAGSLRVLLWDRNLETVVQPSRGRAVHCNTRATRVTCFEDNKM